jgi:hypothetical protein
LSPLTIEKLGPECWVGTWEDTFMQCWGARTDGESVAQVRLRARRFCAEREGARGGLVYLQADSRPPDATARRELSELARELEGRLGAIAYVYSGTGFRAAAIRSVMGALLYVGSLSTRLSTRTFAEPGAAAHWLASKMPMVPRCDPGERLRQFERLLAEFNARGASATAD